MSQPKIVCVVPSIRPERMAEFREAWQPLFERHSVTLVTVWDGEEPRVETWPVGAGYKADEPAFEFAERVGGSRDLFCRFTDGIRNIGFVKAAQLGADYVLTLDDDVAPIVRSPMPAVWECTPAIHIAAKRVTGFVHDRIPADPIQDHLDALALRVPISWMNTAHCGAEYLRGVPYGVRDEAPVMLSHGVWVGTPDFDGESQLRLETCAGCGGTGKYTGPAVGSAAWSAPNGCIPCNGTGKRPGGVPKSLPYYVGPVPRGVLFPLCGMSVMVRRKALPHLFFAPMGPDSGVPDLHRFADIFMGAYLKKEFDRLGWACYTGASVIHHTRASDARNNYEREVLGRAWLEEKRVSQFWGGGTPVFFPVPDDEPGWHRQMRLYFESYADKRYRYANLIRTIQEKP